MNVVVVFMEEWQQSPRSLSVCFLAISDQRLKELHPYNLRQNATSSPRDQLDLERVLLSTMDRFYLTWML